jgi:DNA polymerase-3 subunit delta
MTGGGAAGAPAYLVRGPDPPLVGQVTSELVASLSEGEDPSLLVEDHGPVEGGIAAALEACSTPPFFGGRRVVVARDVGRLGSADIAAVLSYLEHPLPTSSLVLVAGGGPLSSKLVAGVRKVGHVIDAGPPHGKGRGSWIAEHAARGPVRMDRGALDLVEQHLGEDLARLDGLCDILAATYGEGARLSAEQVEPFLGEAGAVPPWELTDALDRGATEPALAILHRLLEAGQRHPLAIMAILHRHYEGLLRLDGAQVRSDQEAAQVVGTGSAWRGGKVLRQARHLGSDRISQAVQLLAAADLALRGASALPPEPVLEVLVARLCRLSRQSARGSRGRVTGGRP